MVGANIVANSHCDSLTRETDRFQCEIDRVADIMAYISIPLAVGSIIIIGIMLITSVSKSSSPIAAATLKRLAMVGIGLAIVFNAPVIASLVVQMFVIQQCAGIQDPIARDSCVSRTFISGIDADPVAGGGEIDPALAGRFSDIIDSLSFISLPLAVLAVVLTGTYLIGNVLGHSSDGASKNITRLASVLVGLVLIMNAPQFVKLFV